MGAELRTKAVREHPERKRERAGKRVIRDLSPVAYPVSGWP